MIIQRITLNAVLPQYETVNITLHRRCYWYVINIIIIGRRQYGFSIIFHIMYSSIGSGSTEGAVSIWGPGTETEYEMVFEGGNRL